MNKLLVTLLLCLVALPALAQFGTFTDQPFLSKDLVSEQDWLVHQDFEGPGYDNGETWVETAAGTYVIEPAFTNALSEQYALWLVEAGASTGAQTTYDFTSNAEIYVYFQLVVTQRQNFMYPLTFGRSSGPTTMDIVDFFQINGSLQPFVAASGAGIATSDAITLGTTNHYWLHYRAGTGANAYCSVGWSTTGIKPTSGNKFAEKSNESATLGVNRIQIGNATLGSHFQNYIFDRIRVSTTSIGDNPGP